VKVFEGTYQDFLDRVGWKNEEGESPSPVFTATPAPSLNKKNVRKIKAEIMSERTRTIGPLQREIAGIEEMITLIEKQLDADTEKLLEASVKGDGDMIRTLSKTMHEAKEKIESLFERLATLTDDLDAKTREFEERLNEFSEVSKAGS